MKKSELNITSDGHGGASLVEVEVPLCDLCNGRGLKRGKHSEILKEKLENGDRVDHDVYAECSDCMGSGYQDVVSFLARSNAEFPHLKESFEKGIRLKLNFAERPDFVVPDTAAVYLMEKTNCEPNLNSRPVSGFLFKRGLHPELTAEAVKA